MLSNYFTLKALVNEWATLVSGSEIEDSYSQSRGELTIAMVGSTGGETDRRESLKIATLAPDRHMYCYHGQNRAKKNTQTIFSSIISDRISDVSIADSDRQITFILDSGKRLRVDLYGSRANVYILEEDGTVSDRFRQLGESVGTAPSAPRSGRAPLSAAQLEAGIMA